MDFQLKQWKDQRESEGQHSSNIPKLFPEAHQPSGSALPLFVSEVNNLSPFPDSISAATRFPRIGSYFSLAQRQELEMQALIFRYMLAGAAVPPELLQPIKKSVLHSHPYFLHFPSYQSALSQSGYWGKTAMDPEPGRCRRTDGKKWRCSRDVVAGLKYCERHMHRGRNRSRKPVESPTSSTAGEVGGGGPSLGATTAYITAPHFTAAAVSTISPFDPLQLNQSSSRAIIENKGLFGNQNGSNGNSSSGDGHVLRHFFDDWPRSLENQDNAENDSNSLNSSTCLSISMPGNSASDVSLKLSTGDGEDTCPRNGNTDFQLQHPLGWAGGWNPTSHVASMGGPLAEALRSSTSSSPTSVLHQVTRCSASEG